MSLRQNALVLAVLTALIAIIGAWSDVPQLAGLWRFPLALLLLGLAYERWMTNRAQPRFDLSSDARALLGRPAFVRIAMRHRLARPIPVELIADPPAGIEAPKDAVSSEIPPGDGGVVDVRIVARRLGEHVWPAIRARFAGPLGLAWWPQRIQPEFKLQVAPDLLREDRRRAGLLGVGPTARSMLGAGAEVLQLRDYRPGDPQHWIDWKATARIGRLISRDYSEDQHLDIVIAIDAGRASGLRSGELDRLGHFVNLAARFAEHAIAQDDRVGLVIFSDRPLVAIPPLRGLASVLRIRGALELAKVDASESNPLNAALRVRTLVRHRSLVVLLTDLDDATVAGQLASAARLLLPKHLPLMAGLSSPEAERLASSPARTWLGPYQALAAQEYCARLARNVLALRALGAPALLAPPDQLEKAVFQTYAEFRSHRRV